MFAQAEVSPVPARGRGWCEVKLWGGDSESVGAEYIDTVQYQGPCTVGTEDMDTSQATSHVPLSTHMVVGSSISTEFVDYSPDVNIIY